jgi:hypothetical protein
MLQFFVLFVVGVLVPFSAFYPRESKAEDPFAVLPPEITEIILKGTRKDLVHLDLVSRRWNKIAAMSPIRKTVVLLKKADAYIQSTNDFYEVLYMLDALDEAIAEVSSFQSFENGDLLASLRDSRDRALVKLYHLVPKPKCFPVNHLLNPLFSKQRSLELMVSDKETLLQNLTRLFVGQPPREIYPPLMKWIASHPGTTHESHRDLLRMAGNSLPLKTEFYLGLLDHPAPDPKLVQELISDRVELASYGLPGEKALLARLVRDPRVSKEDIEGILQFRKASDLKPGLDTLFVEATLNENLDFALLEEIYKKGRAASSHAKCSILEAVAKNELASPFMLSGILEAAEALLSNSGMAFPELNRSYLISLVAAHPRLDYDKQREVLKLAGGKYREDILAGLASNPAADLTVLEDISRIILDSKEHRATSVLVSLAQNLLTPTLVLNSLLNHYSEGQPRFSAFVGIHPHVDLTVRQLAGENIVDRIAPNDIVAFHTAAQVFLSWPQEKALLMKFLSRIQRIANEWTRAKLYVALIKNTNCDSDLRTSILADVVNFKSIRAQVQILPLLEAVRR